MSRPPRLPRYNYTTPGAYFVTVVTRHRYRLLSTVRADGVRLSRIGAMVAGIWDELPRYYAGVATDAFVVMPDHVHGIIVVTTSERIMSLPDVLHRFKSLTTARYREDLVRTGRPMSVSGRLWQAGYYERVIRDHRHLTRVRRYIERNPMA